MEILRRRAHARAGLVGNPSDGYGGKTISFIVRNFFAEVILYEWEDVDLVLSEDDRKRFSSVRELVRDVEMHGYYGGVRLVKSAIKQFVHHCDGEGIELHERNFSIRYESNIPRQVGLAGSSAIVVATLRALCDFYGVAIPSDVQASLALRVENRELGISAGLQDRVIQVYEGVVFMDFSEEVSQRKAGLTVGAYEPLPTWPPSLYVAYNTEAGEPTEVFHNNLKARFNQGEPAIVDAMHGFAELAAEAKQAILDKDESKLSRCIDENFNLRDSICQLPEIHVNMIREARMAGASAKFAGSGGAIVGLCDDDSFEKMKERFADIQCDVFRPQIECSE